MRTLAIAATALLLTACQSAPFVSPAMLPAQPEAAPVKQAFKLTDDEKLDALKKGVAVLLKFQQGDNKAEWPYEGVYRVAGTIPWGYRVGGTAICAMALVEAPGYVEDAARKDAVARGVKFICESKTQPLLSVAEYDAGYDVRSWGHIQAVYTLCRMKQMKVIPEDQEKTVEEAIAFYLDAIQQLEIPRLGGWNYARPAGKTTVAPPSSFMTSSALHALFEAKRAGYTVDEAVVSRALAFLNKARSASGAIMYAGVANEKSTDRLGNAVPGAVGRMAASESTLVLAGQSSEANVRASVDAFIVHWDWLNKRRAQPKTHEPPYMIAPYYFMFAHYYAAEAVELLPKSERDEYRRRVNELLFSVRAEDGSWNDRVFERSSAYGTAMAMMAIMAPDRLAPARWEKAP